MSARFSRSLALLGLALMAGWILRPPAPGAAAVVAAAPLAVLLLAGLRPLPRWGIATAIVMLPYFSYGVMALLTDAGARGTAVAFSALTVVVFLAALDSQRRR